MTLMSLCLFFFFSLLLHLNTEYCANRKLSPILPLSEKKIPPINNTWFKNVIEEYSQNITSHTGWNIQWCRSLIVWYYFLLYFIITISHYLKSFYDVQFTCPCEYVSFSFSNTGIGGTNVLKGWKRRENHIRIWSLTILIKMSSLISSPYWYVINKNLKKSHKGSHSGDLLNKIRADQLGDARTEYTSLTLVTLKCQRVKTQFLAHLTRRVMWAIAITWRPSSIRKHFNLLLENHWSKWDQTWQECSFAWSNRVLLLSLRSVIQHGCQGL